MLRQKILLLAIFAIACLFRFQNLNWDSNQHLHPDERFLTMVGNSMKMPESFHDYLNPEVSTFNPVNVGHTFYVYGVFPVVLNKLIAIQLGNDDYNAFTLQGRALSAVCDMAILLLVYKIAQLLFHKEKDKNTIAILAAFFYAIAVLPIQLSHFFTTDMFLSLGMIAGIYFALRYYHWHDLGDMLLSSICIGLAIASKINAVLVLPLVLLLICLPFMNSVIVQLFKKHTVHVSGIWSIAKAMGVAVLFLVCMYVVVRFANPYMFESLSFFNPQLSSVFIQNIQSLKALDGNQFFPPAVQWFSKVPIVYSLKDIVLYGIGCFYALFLVIGVAQLRQYKKNLPLLLITVWGGLFFLYQSTQFVKTMRYFIFLYPFFALYASLGAYYCMQYIQTLVHAYSKKMYSMAIGIVLVLLLIWPVAFTNIYLRKHSRVAASEWIYAAIPSGATIVTEHWDDGLPLGIDNPDQKMYIRKELPVFAPDSEEKWKEMDTLLGEADYYILSSNRAWGSITTVPQFYTKTITFYEDLFAEKTDFTKVQEFTSYPQISLFGITLEIPDEFADEAFTVYDHPKVMIYKKKQ